MAGMIAHPVALLNQPRQTRQRPDSRGVAGGLWTVENDLSKVFLLGGSQPRLATGGTFAAQSVDTGLLPRLLPRMSRLAADPQLTSDHTGAESFFEQLGGLESPLFHRLMITLVCHVPTIAHPTTAVSLLYEYQ